MPNKITREWKEIASSLVLNQEVQANLLKRLKEGRADKIMVLLCHYAFGVPKQAIQLEQGETPLSFTLTIDAPDSERERS